MRLSVGVPVDPLILFEQNGRPNGTANTRQLTKSDPDPTAVSETSDATIQWRVRPST